MELASSCPLLPGPGYQTGTWDSSKPLAFAKRSGKIRESRALADALFLGNSGWYSRLLPCRGLCQHMPNALSPSNGLMWRHRVTASASTACWSMCRAGGTAASMSKRRPARETRTLRGRASGIHARRASADPTVAFHAPVHSHTAYILRRATACYYSLLSAALTGTRIKTHRVLGVTRRER